MIHSIRKFFSNLGPGAMVAAAFIGPGTLTVCAAAGAEFGYALLWIIPITLLITFFLQDLAVRIALAQGIDLAPAIRESFQHPLIKRSVVLSVVMVIAFGNAAYQSGNISGASLALDSFDLSVKFAVGKITINFIPIVLALMAIPLLYFKENIRLDRLFVGLIFLMSLSFILSLFFISIEFGELLRGLFIPKVPSGSILAILSLVGTTIVPYNFFLHSSTVRRKWNNASGLKMSRFDSAFSLFLGGLVTASILIGLAASKVTTVDNFADLSAGMENAFGSRATYFLAFGMFIAGLSSAVTAPLAAAYVVASAYGQSDESNTFRLTWVSVLLVGAFFAATSQQPIELIRIAQGANAILLPLLLFVLLRIASSAKMGKLKNHLTQNVIGWGIFMVTILLSALVLIRLLT
ncbi:MAG: Nramp family divalent metal transporter [Cyclobacteriaceae bacterium]|nr:Nramp family divalent metal transporter [Cyclobacteriaceae bacterium]MCH8515326.1 Nramp family divalent metal transporter [Cyclobacteriaceae bacterium]